MAIEASAPKRASLHYHTSFGFQNSLPPCTPHPTHPGTHTHTHKPLPCPTDLPAGGAAAGGQGGVRGARAAAHGPGKRHTPHAGAGARPSCVMNCTDACSQVPPLLACLHACLPASCRGQGAQHALPRHVATTHAAMHPCIMHACPTTTHHAVRGAEGAGGGAALGRQQPLRERGAAAGQDTGRVRAGQEASSRVRSTHGGRGVQTTRMCTRSHSPPACLSVSLALALAAPRKVSPHA